MAGTFGDLSAQLTGVLPGLSPILAETFINNAWRKIRDHRPWSFLTRDAVVICPPQVASGTFNITQYSATVIANAVARTALLAIAQPALTRLQIRFMGLAQTSQVYSILTVVDTNPTLTITLDRAVQEATNALSPYLVYRCYIAPPDPTFAQWESLDDMVHGIQIDSKRLSYSSAYFDVRDPQRQSLGQAYFCGLFKSSTVTADRQLPLYELWPGPTQGQTWYARYRSRGDDFASQDDPLPAIIPDDLVIDMALLHWGYAHVQANIGQFPTLARSNWGSLFQEKRITIYGDTTRVIAGSLQSAVRNDDTMALQSVYNRGHGLKPTRPFGFYGPVDANYIQRHAITW
jgi:hypothetical protein